MRNRYHLALVKTGPEPKAILSQTPASAQSPQSEPSGPQSFNELVDAWMAAMDEAEAKMERLAKRFRDA